MIRSGYYDSSKYKWWKLPRGTLNENERIIPGHTVYRGLDWTGLDWTSKTPTSKTQTGKTWTRKTRTGKTQTGKLVYSNYRITDNSYYYTLNSPSLFWLTESVRWIFEISARDVMTTDYTIIMSRTLKVTGNHVKYDRGAWFLRVIISSSRALCCLPSVKKQRHDFNFFSF